MQEGDWGGGTSEDGYFGHHSCDIETNSFAFAETFPVSGMMHGTTVLGCEQSLLLVWGIYLSLLSQVGSLNYLSERTL